MYVVKESGQFSCREFRCFNVRFFLLKMQSNASTPGFRWV